MFYSADNDMIAQFISNPDYSPFIIPYFLNIKSLTLCVYVNKKSKYKTVDDLKGAGISLRPSKTNYYFLRGLLSESPEKFFSSFTASPNTMSSIYALAMNTTDAISTGDNTVNFLKVNNLEPVKKIIALKCSDPFLYPPIMAKKKMPEDMKKNFTNFLSNIEKEESMKKYRSLIKTYKAGFSPAPVDGYKPITALFKKHRMTAGTTTMRTGLKRSRTRRQQGNKHGFANGTSNPGQLRALIPGV